MVFFRACLLFLTLLACLPTFGQTPQGFDEYIDLEQNYNVFGRTSEVLSPEQAAERNLFGIYIPSDQLTVVRSKKWREDPWASVLGDHRLSLPLFVRNDQEDKMNLIKDANPGALVFSEQKALRLQGKSSFLSWCDGCQRPMTFLKIQTKWGSQQKNTAYHGQLAVRVNDVIESLMEGASGSGVDYFPERFSVAYKDDNVRHSYSVRSLETKFQSAMGQSNEVMLPVHGILRKEFFAERGWDLDQWVLEEYIPHLAKMNAYLQFEKGIYLEGHTQNLVVFVDQDTGEINRMAFRDIADIMIDPFIGLAKGEKHHYESLKETTQPCLIYQRTYEDPDIPTPKAYYEWYMGQGITTSTKNWFKKRKIAKKYLQVFFAEYESLTGEAVPRSIRRSVREGFALQYLGSESSASIMGNAAEALQKHQFAKLWQSYFRPQNFKEVPVSEKSVELIQELLKTNSFVFFESHALGLIKGIKVKSSQSLLKRLFSVFSRSRAKLYFDGDQLFIQKSNGRPLGLAYMLSEEQKLDFRLLLASDPLLSEAKQSHGSDRANQLSVVPQNRAIGLCELSLLGR